MSKPYPREFRDDVARVARERGSGVSLAQIAKQAGKQVGSEVADAPASQITPRDRHTRAILDDPLASPAKQLDETSEFGRASSQMGHASGVAAHRDRG